MKPVGLNIQNQNVKNNNFLSSSIYKPRLAYTPISWKNLASCIIGYPKAESIVEKFKNGFPLNFIGHIPKSSKIYCPNISIKNLDILAKLIKEEISALRMDGPFDKPPFENCRCSPMFLVEKKGDW